MADHIQPHQPEPHGGDEYIANRRLARVYAEALMNIADKRGEAESLGEELRVVVQDVLRPNPPIGHLFASRALKRAQKEPLLREAFEGRLSDTLLNFILVLNQRDRLELLRSVFQIYRGLLDERAKRVRVHVSSAAPLDEDQQRRLREMLQASLRLDPVMDVSVDPELLGGMVVRVGDEVYDSSVRTRIETIRDQLLARSNYEVQAGRNRFSDRQAD